jgi:ubiquinone/menaquinone biosynthesis C-methylase UbiE
MIHDAAYFRKWYRDPRHRVRTRAELDRQVRFVVAAAEHLLMRSVRTVLDVGAGEGAWHAALQRVRPSARYWGVDPSEYAVRRYGKSRRIVRGDAETLDRVAGIPESVDLVVCASVLQYLTPSAMRAALPVGWHSSRSTRGVTSSCWRDT